MIEWPWVLMIAWVSAAFGFVVGRLTEYRYGP